jgi:NTP pyrophosphatase (non-canonical NTP hydrolase)
MDFDKYQKEAKKLAKYPRIGRNFIYPTLGLAGEAGEVAEKVKKIFRDDKNRITKKRREEIKKELGDLMWYLAQTATEFGMSLKDIAEDNIKKLNSRKKRGVISGDGDNR